MFIILFFSPLRKAFCQSWILMVKAPRTLLKENMRERKVSPKYRTLCWFYSIVFITLRFYTALFSRVCHCGEVRCAAVRWSVGVFMTLLWPVLCKPSCRTTTKGTNKLVLPLNEWDLRRINSSLKCQINSISVLSRTKGWLRERLAPSLKSWTKLTE